MGALLGLFAVVQAFLLFRKRKPLQKPYYFSLWFLFTVILTGLFGAIVVKLNLAHLSISVHLLFAIVLIQIQLALLLSINSKSAVLTVDRKTRKILLFFLILLFIQSVLGTMVRMHIDDISKNLNYQQRETWLTGGPVAFLIHRSFSWAVLLCALYMAWMGRSFPAVKNKLFVLAAIVLLSMVTGIILFYAGMPKAAQPIHLLLATLAITQSFSIILQLKSNNNRLSSN